jgi:hypothetical protein
MSWLEMQIAAHALFSRPMGGEKEKNPESAWNRIFKKIINEADPMKSGEQRGG